MRDHNIYGFTITSQNIDKMSASTSKSGGLTFGQERDRKSTMTTISPEPASDDEQEIEDGGALEDPCLVNEKMERRLVRKIDLRLCTIAGVLCSLNLLDRFVYPRVFEARWKLLTGLQWDY